MFMVWNEYVSNLSIHFTWCGFIVDFSSMSSLSNLGCVNFTFNNMFTSFDFLHSSKMLIFLFFYCKSINVGYKSFSVISQDIMRFGWCQKLYAMI